MALALVAAGGCDSSPTPPPEDLLGRLAAEGCPTPDRLAPATWAVAEASAFTFRVPDGYREVMFQPVGVEAGLFLRDGEYLGYEMPWRPSPEVSAMSARPLTRPGLIACSTTLAGRGVELSLEPAEPQLEVRAHWPAFLPGPADGHLTFVGRADDRPAANDLLSSILSLEPR